MTPTPQQPLAELADVAPCEMRIGRELLPRAIELLDQCGAFLTGVYMEATCYRAEFLHPHFDGCETQFLCTVDKERGTFTARLNVIGPTAQATEARRAETLQDGSVADESAVGSADAPKGAHP